MTTNNKIRDDFLNYLQHYKQITGDDYSASQMAAIATRTAHGITKEQLIDKLNGKQEANNMNNDLYTLIEIGRQLKRIADALEESNNMIKDLK